ncbi:hypothetical protein ABEB36_003099 [Hypothenemus hampei]|uniref:Uncharacterized protein n=1 Tax=Hypothenemus hampei TaxID=57062 RepID=A0ABD1FB66_HYPHA
MNNSEEDSEICVAATIAIVMCSSLNIKRLGRRQRTLWTRKWLQRRTQGKRILQMLNAKLRIEDHPSYRNFLRLSSSLFEKVLQTIEKDITKIDTVMRESISARNRHGFQ